MGLNYRTILWFALILLIISIMYRSACSMERLCVSLLKITSVKHLDLKFLNSDSFSSRNRIKSWGFDNEMLMLHDWAVSSYRCISLSNSAKVIWIFSALRSKKLSKLIINKYWFVRLKIISLKTQVPGSGAAAFYGTIVIKIGGCCHSRTTEIVAYGPGTRPARAIAEHIGAGDVTVIPKWWSGCVYFRDAICAPVLLIGQITIWRFNRGVVVRYAWRRINGRQNTRWVRKYWFCLLLHIKRLRKRLLTFS